MFQIEEVIRKAIQNGAFDNLPGQGQPLKLEENPFEDPAQYLAHHILKVNGFVPAWIEKDKEIEKSLRTARKGIASAWKRTASHRNTDEICKNNWQKAVARFKEQILRINRQILSYNLVVPSIHFQRKIIDAEKEILQLTTTPPSDKLLL